MKEIAKFFHHNCKVNPHKLQNPSTIGGITPYYNTKQVLICICGSLKVKCFDGEKEVVYELNKPYEALYIEAHVWRTTFEHSSDSVLLVLSSLEYSEEDYIRNYDDFLDIII